MSMLRNSVITLTLLIYFFYGYCPVEAFDKPEYIKTKIVSVRLQNLKNSDLETLYEKANPGKVFQYNRYLLTEEEGRRDGLYFIIRFDRALRKLPQWSSIKIKIISGNQPTEQTFLFLRSENCPKFTREVYCGITSKAISPKEVFAWSISLMDPEGKVICDKKSYVWPFKSHKVTSNEDIK